MTTLATAFILAAVKNGLLSEKKIKKDGTVKARPYQVSKGWPRLKPKQSSFKQVEVQ